MRSHDPLSPNQSQMLVKEGCEVGYKGAGPHSLPVPVREVRGGK